MSEKPVVGFIGVGLMGWGMAKNAVEKGWPLLVVAHRKREAVDDLVKRGAREVASVAEMARQADVIVLCVTGSPEVEANVDIIRRRARPGLTILDASTSEPASTKRLHSALAQEGVTFIDIPLSRTPAHAWEGELTTFVGGEAALVEKWRPLLETWAKVVIPVNGPVGAAHAVKLANNLVSIGYAALWSECFAMMERLDLAPEMFREVVTNSGMNCGNFQNFAKFPCEGDPNGHKFSLQNCLKDMTYYQQLAADRNAPTPMSAAALRVLQAAQEMDYGARFLPEMADVVRRLKPET